MAFNFEKSVVESLHIFTDTKPLVIHDGGRSEGHDDGHRIEYQKGFHTVSTATGGGVTINYRMPEGGFRITKLEPGESLKYALQKGSRLTIIFMNSCYGDRDTYTFEG